MVTALADPGVTTRLRTDTICSGCPRSLAPLPWHSSPGLPENRGSLRATAALGCWCRAARPGPQPCWAERLPWQGQARSGPGCPEPGPAESRAPRGYANRDGLRQVPAWRSEVEVEGLPWDVSPAGGHSVGWCPRRNLTAPADGSVQLRDAVYGGRASEPLPRGGGGGGRGVRLSEVLGTEGRGACARPSLRCRDVRSPLLHPPAVCACQRLGSPHPLCPLSLPGGHCASGGFQGTPGAGEAVAEQISRHPQSPEPGEPRHGAQPAVSFLCPGQRPLRARPLPARPPLAPQLRLGSRARGLRAR